MLEETQDARSDGIKRMLDKVVAECGVDHEDAYDQSKKLDDLITRYYED